jgi:RNA polymerase sigma-70 factor (ECF subfamily)
MSVKTTEYTPRIEQLVQAHQRDIWRFLLALGCRPAEAEDLVQEVFIEVLRGKFEYRSEPETAAWLRRVAKHRFISTARRRKRAPQVRNLDDVDAEWADFNRTLYGDRRIEFLRACIQALPDRSKRALELRYRKEISREEMADALGMKASGVKTLLERVRAALRECVSRRMAADDQ